MSKEKVIEIKINDVTYIVSEVNRNDDHLKQIIKDILIEILKYEQKINNMIKYRCLILCFILQEVKWNKKNNIRQQFIVVYH